MTSRDVGTKSMCQKTVQRKKNPKQRNVHRKFYLRDKDKQTVGKIRANGECTKLKTFEKRST